MVSNSSRDVGEIQSLRRKFSALGAVTATVAFCGVACSAAGSLSTPPTEQVAGHGPNAGGQGNNGGGPGYVFTGGSGTAGGAASSKTCGDGNLDPNEQCDDGVAPQKKTEAGAVDTGCSALCQIEANWSCPTPGQACQYLGTCGNGVLTSNKACDDSNTTSGDGCSSDCQTLEPGWTCRVAGKPCTPTCGDGVVELGKQCDDENTDNGDGCSSTCQVEPGWGCTKASPSVCTQGKCGNGKLETGEACDCGTDPTKLPDGCTGPNGLFNGDGSGCSKTCTKEPVCRGTDGAGDTHACATTCGNGNVETGEDCDDGNLISGDGCSPTCQTEPGFICDPKQFPDTQACTQSINTGDCLELPIKYRDFKSEHESGGHPDFFYYGATLATAVSITGVQGQSSPMSFDRRYCVPNSAGPARQNDATARCWDMAQANLDANGRPAFNTSRNGGGNNAILCDCQFTDWSHDTNGGHVPGYTTTNSPTNGLTYVSGSNGHPMYKGPAPVTASATSFGQWWMDNSFTSNTHTVGMLELGPVPGSTNLYRFSSAPHTTYGGFFAIDPAANKFPIYTLTGSTAGPGTVRTSTTGNNEPLLCNLWPYWYSSASFGAGNGCKGDQYVFPPSFAPGADAATWFGQHPNGDWITNAQGWFHDSWYSAEARYLFAFNDAFQLQFFGDDDTFVFINGKMVIDLGGVHQRLPASVKVDKKGQAMIQEGGNIYMACTNPTGQTNCPVIPTGYAVGDLVPCDGSANAKDPITKVAFNSTCTAGTKNCDCRQRTLDLGLKTGSTYEIAVFQRDGHPPESNFQLTLSGFSTTRSVCNPRCGDGVVTGGEECDCGDGSVQTPSGCVGPNDDSTYGGCSNDCHWGPYCGDEQIQSPEEDCDLGKQNGDTSLGADGCSFGCKKMPYCGDGFVQTDRGENCDLGAAKNGQDGQACDKDCKYIITVIFN